MCIHHKNYCHQYCKCINVCSTKNWVAGNGLEKNLTWEALIFSIFSHLAFTEELFVYFRTWSVKGKYLFYPLSVNLTKWSNTLKQFVGNLTKNCLSVFDHFVGLTFKGLKRIICYSFLRLLLIPCTDLGNFVFDICENFRCQFNFDAKIC